MATPRRREPWSRDRRRDGALDGATRGVATARRQASVSVRRQPRRTGRGRSAAAHRGARDPACLARRLDLAEPEREAAGDGRRRGGPAPVPLPPRLPGGARAREVRPAGAVRRVAARPPQDARPSPCARAVRAGVGVRRRRHARQPRLVQGRLRAAPPHEPHLRHHNPLQAPRDGSRSPGRLPLSREAPGRGANDGRRSRHRRRRARAPALRRRRASAAIRSRWSAGEPDRPPCSTSTSASTSERDSRRRTSAPGAARCRQRATSPTAGSPRRRATSGGSSRPLCGVSARSSATRRPSRARPT